MKVDRKIIYKKYSGRCAYCGKEIEFKDMQVDHILPVSNGGKDEYDNLNPSCRLCKKKRTEKNKTILEDKLDIIIDITDKVLEIVFRTCISVIFLALTIGLIWALLN